MAKKKKKDNILWWLLGGVAALFAFGGFNRLIEDFQNNIGFTIIKVKIGFSGSIISVFNINIPSALRFTIQSEIRNANPVGGQVLGFNGRITYGKGGPLLATVTNTGFDLPPNQTTKADFYTDVSFLSMPQSVREIVAQVRTGQIKNVFVVGTLSTSYGNVQIENQYGIVTG